MSRSHSTCRAGTEPCLRAWDPNLTVSLQAVVGDGVCHHFQHRLPMGNIQMLEVAGDVKLDFLRVL